MHTTLAPVCGCDGITYWNSAYLAGSAKSAQSQDPCGAGDMPKAKVCTEGTCGGNQHCVLTRTGCAAAGAFGTCWTLPDSCDKTTATEIACEGLMDGNCTNVCDLIFNNKPFRVETPACMP